MVLGNYFDRLGSKDGPASALIETRVFARSAAERRRPELMRRADTVRYGGSTAHPHKLISIDPGVVEWMLVPRYLGLDKNRSYVRGGEWDRSPYTTAVEYLGTKEGFADPTEPRLARISDLGFYRAMKRRFDEGIAWEETDIYERFRSGAISKRYSTPDRMRNRFAAVDSLFQHMREHGYLTQRELRSRIDAPMEVTTTRPPERDEVMVSIGRNGEVIFVTGRHRFFVARVLEIDRIPVRVHIRHQIWQQRRHRFRTMDRSRLTLQEKRQLRHPDMNDIVRGG